MDSHNPLNLGLIGCGDLAQRYLRACGDLFHCVACCDRLREAAEDLRAEWRIGAAYTDVHKLLRRNDIDLVLVLTPAAAHAELIPAIAESRKHVYVDGPLATTREETQRVIEACQTASVNLGLVQYRRTLARIVAAKRVLESKLLGEPFLAHGETAGLRHWPDEPEILPGLLSEAVTPEIDLLCYLLQQPVTEAYARAGRGPFRTAKGARGETWATLTLTFASGLVAQMFHSWDCHGEQPALTRRFHLECARGALFVNESGPDPVAAYLADQCAWLRPDLPEDHTGLRRDLKLFLDRLADDAPSEGPAPDQLRALEAAWAVAESLERNVPIAVQPLFPESPAEPEPEPWAPETPSVGPPSPSQPIRLSPEDAGRYAARLVPQADPPMLIMSDPPSMEEEASPPSSEDESALASEEPSVAETLAPEAVQPLPPPDGEDQEESSEEGGK